MQNNILFYEITNVPLKNYFPVIIIIYLFMDIYLDVTEFAGKI